MDTDREPARPTGGAAVWNRDRPGIEWKSRQHLLLELLRPRPVRSPRPTELVQRGQAGHFHLCQQHRCHPCLPQPPHGLRHRQPPLRQRPFSSFSPPPSFSSPCPLSLKKVGEVRRGCSLFGISENLLHPSPPNPHDHLPFPSNTFFLKRSSKHINHKETDGWEINRQR